MMIIIDQEDSEFALLVDNQAHWDVMMGVSPRVFTWVGVWMQPLYDHSYIKYSALIYGGLDSEVDGE